MNSFSPWRSKAAFRSEFWRKAPAAGSRIICARSCDGRSPRESIHGTRSLPSPRKSAGGCARAISTTILLHCALNSWKASSIYGEGPRLRVPAASATPLCSMPDIRAGGNGLPIYVPPEDEALVAELLTGLLDETMAGLATEGVEARRYLVNRNGEWLPAVQLLADGEIPPAKLPKLSAQAWVRAIPTGELGNHLAGELALLEPPVGEQRRWRVRPFMGITKLLTGFPFASPVTTTLSSPDDVPCHWTWPRGEALRSDVLVFQQDEGSTPHELLLRFLRSGSVSSTAQTLYVLFPDDWTVQPTTESAVVEIERIPRLGRRLVRLTGAAYFQSSETDPVRFKVEPDADERAGLRRLRGSARRDRGRSGRTTWYQAARRPMPGGDCGFG